MRVEVFMRCVTQGCAGRTAARAASRRALMLMIALTGKTVDCSLAWNIPTLGTQA